MSAVLVLDVGMQPLLVQSWQKAITNVFLGKAEIVEYSRDKTIRSVSQEWKMPSVIRMLSPFKRSRMRVKFSRIGVYARDGFRCQYCGNQKSTEELSYDHVVPRAQGGKTSWENIVTACITCNTHKGNRTPEQAGMRLLSTPKKPHHLPAIQVSISKGTPPEWKDYWNVALRD